MRCRLLIILLVILLAGCASTDSTVEPIVNPPTATASATETPTLTFTPTIMSPTATSMLENWTPGPILTPTSSVPTYDPSIIRYQEGVPPLAAHRRLGMGLIQDLQIAPDQQSFAVGTTTGVYVFDGLTYDLLWSAATRTVVSKIRWSPSGDKLAASLPETDSILIWDTGGQFLTRLETANLRPPFDWSPDGKQIVTGQTWLDESDQIHSTVITWNVDTGEEAGLYEIDLGQEYSYFWSIDGLQWSPDGHYVIVGLYSEHITLALDLSTGDFLRLETPIAIPHEQIRHIEFSPDGSHLLTYSGWILADGPAGNEYAVIWDMDSFEMIDAISPDSNQSHTSDAGWSPDGKYVAVTYPQYFLIWDVAAGEEVYSYHGDDDYFENLIWSPDGTTLIITVSDLMEHSGGSPEYGELWFVDLSDIGQIGIEKEPASWSEYSGWLPNERLLLATDEDLYVRDMLTRRYDTVIRSRHRCIQLARSPDSPIFAALLWGGRSYDVIDAIYWNHLTGESLIAESNRGSLPPDDWVYSSRDPQELTVPANLTYLLDLYNLAEPPRPINITLVDSGRTILDYTGNDVYVYSSAISPDGRYLAFGFGPISCHGCPVYTTIEQAYILLFDTETETYVTLYGHIEQVNSLLFLSDNDLVSASNDGTIIVWDIP